MSYKEALAQTITDIEAGRDPEAAINAHARYTAQLRDDVAVMSRLRAVPAQPVLPDGSLDRGRQRLETALSSARASAPVSTPHQSWLAAFSQSFALKGLAAAAAVLLVAIGLSLASGVISSPFGSTTAEAAYDGVIVDNSNGSLTLQTSDAGVVTFAVAGNATITDDSGTTVRTADLQPGQVVRINAKQRNGQLAALAIRRQALTSLEDWCADHSDACQQLRDRFKTQIDACQQGRPQACQGLVQRLTNLEATTKGASDQLRELVSSCQANRASCQALNVFCAAHQDLCKGAAERQLETSGVDLSGRLKDLQTRCDQDGNKCAALKAFCDQHPNACTNIREKIKECRKTP